MRSEIPFLLDERSQKIIRDISDAQALTLVAGAGVTIDASELGWSGLITELLTGVAKRTDRLPAEEELARAKFVELQGPERAASVAIETIRAKHQDAAGMKAELGRRIGSLLYEGQEPTRGGIAENLALVALTWHALGRRVNIVTTNYDDYIEQSLNVVGEYLGAEVPMRVVTEFGDSDRKIDDGIGLYYLHGYVARDGRIQGHLVLSEEDFVTLDSSPIRETLNALFSESLVLFVGSSVRDPTIVHSLLDTRDPSGSAATRYAVMPMQGEEWQASDRDELNRFQQLATQRFLHLNVTPIYPDFFLQVGQLLREIVVCATEGPQSYTKHDSAIRYESRLERWWSEWQTGLADHPAEAVQFTHRNWLAATRELVRSEIGAPAGENIKVELWLRYEPSERHRVLRLWASSEGAWLEPSSMREDEITTASGYIPIQVFCDGRYRRLDSPRGAPTRWRTYLATPIWLFGDLWHQLPVGVVAVASEAEPGRCSFDRAKPAWGNVVKMLDDIGQRLLDPAKAFLDVQSPFGGPAG